MGKYLVYWSDMLKKDQGDAPMRAFDTTIEANAYINGCVDVVETFTKGVDAVDLIKEFYVQDTAELDKIAVLGED